MQSPPPIKPPPKIRPPPKGEKPKRAKAPAPEKKSPFTQGTKIKVIPSLIPFQFYKLVETYATHYRMDEISHYLRKRLVTPNDSDQYPQEHRKRQKLMETRDRLASYAKILNPRFIPPEDLKTDAKLEERVFVPVDQFPGINFIGILIGPRGQTLKTKRESGAKISIRGKGAVKAGKIDAHQIDSDLDLHVCIMGKNWTVIKKASKMVNNIIESAIAVPEAQNLLKKQQLRELAAINGTLRHDEGGEQLEVVDMTQLIAGEDYNQNKCPICKGEHTAMDCPNKGNPEYSTKMANQNQLLDEEYRKLMGVIGEDSVEVDTKVADTEEEMHPWRKDELEQATMVDDPYLAFYGGIMPFS